ncbi:Putative SKP1/BTB/POZ domain superfamily protein [Colletotrichum destructivum]|uniref:SKP1/BTB/POZ domain superfamily protein n=1 Tax=Colletotrichum destructivum TaxID=34406 RepID=A0AAX4I1B9_9PEZI|nr:Putative SKP1/BTB/POZ domain superfamily protein [Colletotrichum destructivum]
MPDEAFHELDPDGDVVLTLRNPNAPFADWNMSAEASFHKLNLRSVLFWSDWDQPISSEREPEKDETFWAAISTANKKEKDIDDVAQSKKTKKKKMKRMAKKTAQESSQSLDHGISLATEHATEHATDSEALAVGPPSVDDSEQVTMPVPLKFCTSTDGESPNHKTPLQDDVVLEPEVSFLVSSRHLSLASDYFKTQLSSRWRKATTIRLDGRCQFDASDWDVDALLLLLRIIHGRTKEIPRRVDLETLAKVAVLIDYYKCHDAIAFFSDMWVEALKPQLPSECNRELVLWLSISIILQQDTVFQAVTKTAVQKSKGPIPTLELPIPPRLVEAIDWRRQDGINSISKVLANLLSSLCRGSAGCSFECSAFLLGSLTKNMRDHQLLYPTPQEPYLGYELAAVEEGLREFRSTSGYSPGFYHKCSCNLTQMIEGRLYPGINRSKEGFGLSDPDVELVQFCS